MEKCSVCNELPHYAADRCHYCGNDVGAPNVRAARQQHERDALERRYQSALADAKLRGVEEVVERLEAKVTQSSAVINVKIEYLSQWLDSPKILYSNYDKQCRAEIRLPADEVDDKNRRMVEAHFFGAYSGQIIYAALSLNGIGLSSYGPISMRLAESAIAVRTSLLEWNTFAYLFREAERVIVREPPPGSRCDWASRQKLVVAKLVHHINQNTPDEDFPGLVLNSTDHRHKDDFIEAHIYGTLSLDAIESVTGSVVAVKKAERVRLNKIRRRIEELGKSWTG